MAEFGLGLHLGVSLYLVLSLVLDSNMLSVNCSYYNSDCCCEMASSRPFAIKSGSLRIIN